MKSILLILFASICFSAAAQNKKDLTVSLSSGWLGSSYYQKATTGSFFAFDFDYHLSGRQVLGMSYLKGSHRYFDDVRSNAPYAYYFTDSTNADADYSVVSLVYKYKIINTATFSATAGAGLGVLTHELTYPYQLGVSSGPESSSFSDLAFPVSLDVSYRLSKRFQIGFHGGLLIEPDYPVLALHAGPRLSYTLK